MRWLWRSAFGSRSLAFLVLACWLIASGAIPLLGISSPSATTLLHVGAIAAGALLLIGR